MANALRPAPWIGPLPDSEREAAVHLLASSFRDNPLNEAVIRSSNPDVRVRCNLHGMRALLPVAQRHGLVLGARVGGQSSGKPGGKLAGVLIAAGPYAYPLPAPPPVERLRCLWGQGWRVAHRWARVFHMLDALHPMEPVAYLGTLGVDPALQEQSVGTALLDAWLAGLDSDGVGAYLETDGIGTVAFYERAGFDVIGVVDVLGAPVWRMLRPAHSP
jgi:ribosomal protein S18 acetylase RimI-like enzyme